MLMMTCRANRYENREELLMAIMNVVVVREGFINQSTKGASTNGAKPYFALIHVRWPKVDT